jgi:two-component system sensor histidine kinase KdpD
VSRSRDPVTLAALAAISIVAALAIATGFVWLLQNRLGVDDASPTYLLAVTVVAIGFGTLPAALTAILAVLVYNFGFTHPLYTFIVADSGQLLNLALLLVVGIVVGQLTALQRSRAEAAELREREAQLMVLVSRALATRTDTASAIDEITRVLEQRSPGTRAWVALGDTSARERPIGGRAAPRGEAATDAYAVLQRRPGTEPARWMQVRAPGSTSRPDGDLRGFRVPIAAGGATLGALWALRPRRLGEPDLGETRVLAAAADQVGQALEQDRFRAEANSAELARRSDALKSALLDSVSHDLRTPLAVIRASADTLADGSAPSGEVAGVARTIDEEAARLDRIVGNLLDMGRIEGGELHPAIEPYALEDLVEATLRRLRPVLAGRSLAISIPADLPWVLVDATLLDQVLSNVLENAARHAPGAAIRVTAGTEESGGAPSVRLIVEDAGPGVPEAELPRIFDKFRRVARAGARPVRGTGIGLAVVRGLVAAMGGTVMAEGSPLGGLAIVLSLPAAIGETSQ